MGAFPPSEKIMQFGVFELDVRSGDLRRGGKRVHLQDQPFQVLVVLLEYPGEVVTREQLRRRVWPENTFVEFDSALNTAVKKIRIALGDEACCPRFVETVPKRGYRFIAPVGTTAQKNWALADKSNVVHATISRHLRRWRYGLIVGAMVLSFFLGYLVRSAPH